AELHWQEPARLGLCGIRQGDQGHGRGRCHQRHTDRARQAAGLPGTRRTHYTGGHQVSHRRDARALMSYSLFISDLHLDAARPEHVAALQALLEEHAGEAEALYVLGDLFEAWIGDDDDSDFNRNVIALFRAFSERGSKLYFMHGNRDFLLGERFAEQTGGTLLPEGTVIDLYGTPTLLLHGDSLCTADEKYQQFRALVRTPAWQQ